MKVIFKINSDITSRS